MPKKREQVVFVGGYSRFRRTSLYEVSVAEKHPELEGVGVQIPRKVHIAISTPYCIHHRCSSGKAIPTSYCFGANNNEEKSLMREMRDMSEPQMLDVTRSACLQSPSVGSDADCLLGSLLESIPEESDSKSCYDM